MRESCGRPDRTRRAHDATVTPARNSKRRSPALTGRASLAADTLGVCKFAVNTIPYGIYCGQVDIVDGGVSAREPIIHRLDVLVVVKNQIVVKGQVAAHRWVGIEPSQIGLVIRPRPRSSGKRCGRIIRVVPGLSVGDLRSMLSSLVGAEDLPRRARRGRNRRVNWTDRRARRQKRSQIDHLSAREPPQKHARGPGHGVHPNRAVLGVNRDRRSHVVSAARLVGSPDLDLAESRQRAAGYQRRLHAEHGLVRGHTGRNIAAYAAVRERHSRNLDGEATNGNRVMRCWNGRLCRRGRGAWYGRWCCATGRRGKRDGGGRGRGVGTAGGGEEHYARDDDYDETDDAQPDQEGPRVATRGGRCVAVAGGIAGDRSVALWL